LGPGTKSRSRGTTFCPCRRAGQYPESDDEYRHRMIVNAIATAFTSVLILTGVWLANMMAHA
jgi:hypothetical protein